MDAIYPPPPGYYQPTQPPYNSRFFPPVDPLAARPQAVPLGQQGTPAVAPIATPVAPQGGLFGSLAGLSAPGGFVQQVGDRVGANQNMMLGFASGLLGGRKGQGWGQGFQGAMAGSQLDLQKQQIDRKNAQADAQRKALKALGYTDEQIAALTPENAAELWMKRQLLREKGPDSDSLTSTIKDAIFAHPGDPDAQRLFVQQQRPEKQIFSPLEQQQQKDVAEEQKNWRASADGSYQLLRGTAQMKEIIKKGEGKMFGPYAGSALNRGAAAMLGSETEKLRQEYSRLAKKYELDAAKSYLKGQGQVTENERGIVRDTFVGLTAMDDAAALAGIEAIEAEARANIVNAKKKGYWQDPDDGVVSPGASPIQAPTLKDSGQTVNGKKILTYGSQ